MVLAICAVFKVRREAPERSHCDRAGLSKLNSMRALRPLPDSVDISGRRRSSTSSKPALPVPRLGLRLPRKEVIQPHLPVRLPCYDFTPIASPTFDGSLPCGLGHRLRVLPTFVV